MDVIIYHNPACGTSRNTLGLIRNAGVEPHIIEALVGFRGVEGQGAGSGRAGLLMS